MTEAHLSIAMREAEDSEPAVRTAALLRIARVMTRIDQAEAERLLDRGLSLLAELSYADKAALTPQAICLAGCVAPGRVLTLRAAVNDPLTSGKYLFDMVRHGHTAAAAAHLAQWPAQEDFPYDAAQETIGHAGDNEMRREILRAALRASRRHAETSLHTLYPLVRLVRFKWLLPDEEARHELRRLVSVARELPDQGLTGSYGGLRGTVTFSSHRRLLLFELLGALKQVDPELAESVIREHPELTRAAVLYPDGPDTVVEQEVALPSPEALEHWERDWTGFALRSRFFNIEKEQKTDFQDSFDLALRAFARDSSRARRNNAPQECWPSTEDFRTILYAAGRYEGAAGARLLDRIPDPALRLFARIEFAAGMLKLEPIGGITREHLGSS